MSGVFIEERGAGPPVLLLHGAGVDHLSWAPQIGALSARFHLYLPDLPAHGRSGDIAESVEDMASALLDAAPIRRAGPLSLVGLSLGGLAAIEIAARAPEKVRKLILAETSAGTALSWGDRLGARLAACLFSAAGPRMLAALPGWALGAATPEGARYLKETLRRSRKATIRCSMAAALRYDPRPKLSRISAPTLLITGDRNPQLRRHTRFLLRALAHARHERIAGAGHLVNLDAPETFNRLVLEFLGRKQ